MRKDPNHPHEYGSKAHEEKIEQRLQKDEKVMPIDEVPIEEQRKERQEEKKKHQTKNESTSEDRLRP